VGGLMTAMNAAYYNFMKYAKLREMHQLAALRKRKP